MTSKVRHLIRTSQCDTLLSFQEAISTLTLIFDNLLWKKTKPRS